VKYLGIMMVSHENDILGRVLAEHSKIVDAFYVLDGTIPSDVSEAICRSFDKCAGYTTDSELPRPPYPELTTCGYRQWPYEQAVADHGTDNWFLELHGDEVWTFHPSEAITAHPGADGFIFPLPFYFSRDPWDDNRHPFDQLRWHMEPGWPEFRMFKGNPNVGFDPAQHFNTQPAGLHHVVHAGFPIKHYPYRSPTVQRERALVHQRTGFDPDNYQHILDGDQVVWTDEMIAGALCAHHTTVVCDMAVAG
jgi:hypothetical protein